MARQKFLDYFNTTFNLLESWPFYNFTRYVKKGIGYCSKTKYVFFISLLIVLVSACQKEIIVEPIPETYESYTFFVAGHVYGSPGVDNFGFHPPFRAKFDLINERNTSLGFFLGDIVNVSTSKNWNEVDSVLQYLNTETYFAVGNHDMTDRPLFESRYGKTYFSFKYENDLFVVLDPNIDEWNISEDQLSFLKNVLDTESLQARNVFVFFHQLLWIDKANKYKNVRPNSFEGRADIINFWTEVEPLFNDLANEVYMFAGDIGAAHWSDDAMYDKYDNITLIATGMGEEVGDNFIFIDVDESGGVSFEMIALNGEDIHAMGNIEDYQVRFSLTFPKFETLEKFKHKVPHFEMAD